MKEHKDKCEHKKGEAICMNCPVYEFEDGFQKIEAYAKSNFIKTENLKKPFYDWNLQEWMLNREVKKHKFINYLLSVWDRKIEIRSNGNIRKKSS